MKLPLIFYPTKSLEEPSKKVEDFDAALKLIPDMAETMEAEKGIGIAAPQIGKNIRVAIINKDADKELEDHLVIINPKIFSASRDMDEKEEGCLSIPGVEGMVERHRKIKVRYIDINGQEQKLKATGLFSRVLQHEVDHLDGILFIDKATKITKGKIKK
jgi:peptide deformylase